MKCIHLVVSGRVQGVFFRDNTRRKAIALGLKGYAKNLPDRNVEVVAEGKEDKLKELIEFIRKGPGVAMTENIEITRKEPENFKNFEIRH